MCVYCADWFSNTVQYYRFVSVRCSYAQGYDKKNRYIASQGELWLCALIYIRIVYCFELAVSVGENCIL